MIASLMLFTNLIALLVGLAGLALERFAGWYQLPRRWLWTAILATSLALPAAMVLKPHHIGLGAIAVPTQTKRSAAAVTAATTPRRADTAEPITHIDRSNLSAADAQDLEDPLLYLWVATSIGLLSVFAFSWLRLALVSRAWTSQIIEGRRVWVTDAQGPAVAGLVSPKILIPQWVLNVPANSRELILVHECEHIAARDPLLALGALVLVMALPWCLPLWWQRRRLQFAIEVDCDARVLKRGADIRSYGQTLLNASRKGTLAMPSAVAMSEPASQLERRIRIMTEPRAERRYWIIGGVLGMAVACVVMAAQIAAPTALSPASSLDSEPTLTVKSPFPDLIPDEAYAKSIAKSRHDVAFFVAHPSADNLATAAWQVVFDNTDKSVAERRSQELIAQAEALAPTRPELVWIHLALCQIQLCAGMQQLESHLKAVDNSNGFAWIPDLARVSATGSEADITAILLRIGAGSRLTMYFNQRTVMIVDALAAANPQMTIIERGLQAFGMAAVFPAFQPMTKACNAEHLADGSRRAACEQLMARMEQSDTILAQSLALSVQERWWPAGSSQLAALQAKHRRLDYVRQAAGRLRLFRLNHDMVLRIEAARRDESEEDASRLMIKAFGLSAEPPASWKDPRYPG